MPSIPNNLADILISLSNTSIGDYYPQWMEVHYDTNPVTGSLLRRYLNPYDKENLICAYLISKVGNAKYKDFWFGEPQRGWVTNTSLLSKDIQTCVATLAGSSISIRRAFSEFDFLTAVNPVYFAGEENSFYFRNLEVKLISTSCTGSYTDLDILPGSDYYYSTDGTEWNIVEGNSTEVNNATNTLTLPVTGSFYLVYPSKYLLDNSSGAVININNGPDLLLSRLDFWNSLDEFGISVDVPRLLYEDNWSYNSRLKTVFPFLGGTTEDGLRMSVGRRLGLLFQCYWNGLASIYFGASGATNVFVHELPRYSHNSELVKQQDGLSYLSKRDVSNLYLNKDNLVFSTTFISGRSSGTVLPQDTLATYKYSNYTLSNSGSFVSYLLRTGNTKEAIYEVAWTNNLRVNTLNKDTYKNSSLLLPDGTASNTYMELGEAIREEVPVTLGFTKWEKVHWFLNGESSPRLEYIPIPLDED